MPGSVLPPGRALDFAGIIEGNPAISLVLIGFKQSPFGRTHTIGFLHNGKAPLASVARSGVVGARTRADIQICNADLHQVRFKGGLFRFLLGRRGIDHFAIIGEYAVSSIGICLRLGVGKDTVRTQLGLLIIPGFTDTVIARSKSDRRKPSWSARSHPGQQVFRRSSAPQWTHPLRKPQISAWRADQNSFRSVPSR